VRVVRLGIEWWVGRWKCLDCGAVVEFDRGDVRKGRAGIGQYDREGNVTLAHLPKCPWCYETTYASRVRYQGEDGK
jgi:hypothetical protein